MDLSHLLTKEMMPSSRFVILEIETMCHPEIRIHGNHMNERENGGDNDDTTFHHLEREREREFEALV